MLEELAHRLHDLVLEQIDIAVASLALLERQSRLIDEFDRLADDLYAQSQEDLILIEGG
jgi:hypothetical protein